jgi:hypothetical protein
MTTSELEITVFTSPKVTGSYVSNTYEVVYVTSGLLTVDEDNGMNIIYLVQQTNHRLILLASLGL